MELFNGKYKQELLIGRGAFSEVWKVTDVQTGVVQVLKIYTPSASMGDNGTEMMKHEFALMANTNHQNLLRPLYFDICDGRPFLVLSYCKNGNINSKVGRFTERDAWKLLRDAASALAYLHQQTPPIVHQDIKPANILISDNGSYMLTDFGVSTKAKSSLAQETDEEKMLQTAGTFPYMPPEKFTDNNLPIMASDIWSLGATVFEMLTGQLPFGNDGGLLQRMGTEEPELPGDYSAELKETLSLCLAKEPWKRPKAEELEAKAISILGQFPTLRPYQKDTIAQPVQEPDPQPVSQTVPQPTPILVSEPEPQPAYQPQPAPFSEPEPQPTIFQPQPVSASNTEPEPQPAFQPQPAPVPEPEPQQTHKPFTEPQTATSQQSQPQSVVETSDSGMSLSLIIVITSIVSILIGVLLYFLIPQ